MEKRVSKVEALPRLAPEFRVAAYARVSSEKDAMRHSLSAQVSYYSSLIIHEFDVNELKLIIDAVESSKFINKKRVMNW